MRIEEIKQSATSVTIWVRDSSLGVATRYGLDGPGIEFLWEWGRFSVPVQTVFGAHIASYKMGTGSLSRG